MALYLGRISHSSGCFDAFSADGFSMLINIGNHQDRQLRPFEQWRTESARDTFRGTLVSSIMHITSVTEECNNIEDTNPL